jgi:hypothetical protein
MNMGEVVTLINQVGFPIAVSVAMGLFIWKAVIPMSTTLQQLSDGIHTQNRLLQEMLAEIRALRKG